MAVAYAPDGRPVPSGLRIEPSYATGRTDGSLWLPPRLRGERREKTGIVVPVSANLRKAVYFKGRLYVSDPSRAPSGVDYRWRADWLRCPYNQDIDEPGANGISVRDQIHIWITGVLERAPGGRWVYQNSDERWSTTVIEEWPLVAHSPERFQRFRRREP